MTYDLANNCFLNFSRCQVAVNTKGQALNNN